MLEANYNIDGFKKIEIGSRNEWERLINMFPTADSYYTYDYVNALKIHGDGTPCIFLYKNKDKLALNVSMLRNINEIEHLDINDDRDYFDISTPYGYGGFIYNTQFDNEELIELGSEYEDFCKENNIICEFVRFHPITKNYEQGKYIYDTFLIGHTIAIDLESDDQVWASITSKNRNMIRKARNNAVKIHISNSKKLIPDFMKMYKETMDRDGASEYYYFEKEYYEALFSDDKDDVNFFYASYDDMIISMAIILKKAGQMHYHLSASNYEYRQLASTNLLLFEAAKWGIENDCKTFHLGGGVGGDPHDSLFKFKRSFNRQTKKDFYIGKKIFDKEAYEKLIDSIDKNVELRENFFPKYRAII